MFRLILVDLDKFPKAGTAKEKAIASLDFFSGVPLKNQAQSGLCN